MNAPLPLDVRPVAARSTTQSRWIVLALLVAATTLNFVDRQLPFVLIEHIRADLHLSDTQIGLLGGIAFSLVYSLAAIPIARLSDRSSRRWVMATCVGVWSLMTAAGGLAGSFLQLALSRTGVAVAEAGCNPAAHSLIAELFHRRRGLAIAANTAGVPIGLMIGLAVGGWLADRLDWRHVLFLAGLPGLVLAVAFAVLVRDLPRPSEAPRGRSFAATVRVLCGRPSFLWMTTGATLCALAASGGAAFGAAFLIRVHHLSAGQAGLTFGLILGVCGVIGTMTAGGVSDWLAERTPGGRLYGAAAAMLIMTPLYVLAWLAADLDTYILLFAPAWLALSFFLPMTYSAAQAVAEPDMRATTSALLQLVINISGNALGPILTGVLSDAWRTTAGGNSLGWALATLGGTGLLAAGAYWMAGRSHGRDLAGMSAAARLHA